MITKSASNPGQYKNNIVFTNSAREGWKLILESLEEDSRILLPSYIGITEREGSGIYDPVTNSGLNHDFYRLNDDLSISLDEINNRLEQHDYKLILLVHYFGFKVNNLKDIAELCQSKGIIVVEDCAHLYNYNIYTYSNAGTFGDFAFYSLHKTFPIENGGLLVQNSLKCLDIAIESPLGMDYEKIIFKYDIESIVNKRRNNFNHFHKILANIKGLSILKTMNSGDIPHTCPIYIENGLRERLYFWMMDRSIPLIALYYQLIPPLQVTENKNMLDLSKNILNLPVHQDITVEDIERIADHLKKGLIEIAH